MPSSGMVPGPESDHCDMDLQMTVKPCQEGAVSGTAVHCGWMRSAQEPYTHAFPKG